MIYPSIDKLLNIVNSRYELVNVIAKRSEEITETGHLQKPKEAYRSTKNIGRALEELAEGLIIVKDN